jgi:acyl carrier protein phosphodiesterase
MNYLAHAYLSFNDPQILVGNMISDFVKGKKQFDFAADIQRGIRLHRAIDDFTDTHEATREIKELFRADYRLYSGAFTDIVLDYFLANDVREFADESALMTFTQQVYTSLDEQVHSLPDTFIPFFMSMKKHDFLYHYRFQWGIRNSFEGMARRAKYISDASTAFAIFQENIQVIQPYYDQFFPLLKKYAAHTMEQLLHDDSYIFGKK